MSKYVSYIASEIDAEYRRRKVFEKKQREKCNKSCSECKYERICTETEREDERNDSSK